MYLDLVRAQHCMHLAVQENNVQVRTSSWQYFNPFFFMFNKINYARYGSYYVEILCDLENLYPGLQQLLERKGMSVQDRHCVCTAIDQRGEQTINRDAKTAGGIKSFAANSEPVLKWCLNRSEQAQNTKALSDLCGISTNPELYKPCRPSQIIKSNT